RSVAQKHCAAKGTSHNQSGFCQLASRFLEVSLASSRIPLARFGRHRIGEAIFGRSPGLANYARTCSTSACRNRLLDLPTPSSLVESRGRRVRDKGRRSK